MLGTTLHEEKLKSAKRAKAIKLGLPHLPPKVEAQSDMSQPLDRQNKQAYTLGEVSLLMGFSRATVEKLFKDEPGILKLGHDETMHKRRYNSTRVPKHVYERVVRRLSQ